MNKQELISFYQSKTILQLIPDKFVNNSNNHYITNALSDMYAPVLKRFKYRDEQLYMTPEFICSWEIYLTKKNIQIYLVLPTCDKSCVEKEMNICWSGSTVKETAEYISFNQPLCQRLTLKYHSCFSLNAAKSNDAPLDSIFECARYMKDDEQALVQVLISPLHHQYYQEILEAQEKFKQGTMPTKLNLKEAVNSGLTLVASVALEAASFVSTLICNEEPKFDLKNMMPFEELSEQSRKKARGKHFRTEIRICAEGEHKDTIVKSLYLAFRDMDNDNKLEPEPIDYTYIKERKFSRGKDVLSNAELEKIIQLPSRRLQLSSPVERQLVRENPLPKAFGDSKGILFANYKWKSNDTPVYLPIDNKNEVCRTWVNIAPTGSGKSEKAANFAVEALAKGHSVFTLDPAQGTLCDSIRDALPKDFPEDHIIDFNFGIYDYPVPVHWQAKEGSSKSIANLMANNLISYLNKISSEPMGDRTRELLRSAAKVVFQKNGTLLEIKLMFRSRDFCAKILKGITDLRIVAQWEDYWELKDGSQRQYADPVVSRINTLMGDDFIGNCILQQPKQTDIFRWLNGDLVNNQRIPYCVLLRIPKTSLAEEGLNAIATYWIYAIWLAVLNRNPLYTPISWLLLDEPHQYLGSAQGGAKSIWGQMTSEMRKWGLGVHLYFHDWEQIPKDVRSIFKGSGVNYSLFNTDKSTFQELAEEFAPFELDDFLEMERFYSMNRILYNNQYHTFISKCLLPAIKIETKQPWRCDYIDRSGLTMKCHKIYGRHIDEVEQDIYARESILFKKKGSLR